MDSAEAEGLRFLERALSLGDSPRDAWEQALAAVRPLAAVEELEAQVDRLREALDRASRALDEVVVYFDGSTRIPPAGLPLASVVRPAQRIARDALRGTAYELAQP